MDIFDLMRSRRSIRKYQERQIPRELVEKVLEAGSYAPNAGGRQRSVLVAIHDRELAERLGRLNAARLDRRKLLGGYVSTDQPSIIDDPSIKSGFYGAPTACVVFTPVNFLYGIPDAFCCAENMVLAASELGLASCIIARGEDTFDTLLGRPAGAAQCCDRGLRAKEGTDRSRGRRRRFRRRTGAAGGNLAFGTRCAGWTGCLGRRGEHHPRCIRCRRARCSDRRGTGPRRPAYWLSPFSKASRALACPLDNCP